MRTFLRHFVQDPERVIKQGCEALCKLRRIIALAEEVGLPAEGIKAQYAVYEVLATAREYFFRPPNPEVENRLRGLIRQIYQSQTKSHYVFIVRFKKSRMKASLFHLLLHLLTRRRQSYRLSDRLVLLRLLAWLGWALKYVPAHRLPKVAVSQGVGWRHFLR